MADAVSLPLDAARYRADFPILAQTIHEHQQLVYLDNAATARNHPARSLNNGNWFTISIIPTCTVGHIG